MSSRDAIFLFGSVIRGHHISKSFWIPVVGESVAVACEPSNPYDRNAVSVKKGGNVIGHVPRNTSRIMSTFLSQGGTIQCEVVGRRKYGTGLEVPCIYKLTGEESVVIKTKNKLVKVNNKSTLH